MRQLFIYLKTFFTAPKTLIYEDFRLLEKHLKKLDVDINGFTVYHGFFTKLQKYSLYILLFNFIICVFFCEEAGVDKSFTAENYHNLTPLLDNPNFHFYFVIFIYLSKFFLFLRVNFIFLYAVFYFCFGLTKEEALENKNNYYYFQIGIMFFVYVLLLFCLFVTPGVPEFILTRNINIH